ncbi:MAG TPA: hypothetical protein VEA99_20200, partial [Gemmatimonadaceae bacterium]|nr:hypothetical protein [Gemmatimonadaceae bacterium]
MNLASTRTTALALLASASLLAACSDTEDDGGTEPVQPGAATITTDITGTRTFRAETTYTLSGFIHVAEGATLTIEAGTRIVGDFEVPGSSLIVMPGGRIRAMGTADRPVVFTSERPAGQR